MNEYLEGPEEKTVKTPNPLTSNGPLLPDDPPSDLTDAQVRALLYDLQQTAQHCTASCDQIRRKAVNMQMTATYLLNAMDRKDAAEKTKKEK